MLSFSSHLGAHDEPVNRQSSSSKSIQTGKKVPVQAPDFDDLNKGASMGAQHFIEQDKINIYQRRYNAKTIPSPGTTYSENPA
ncbi:hypothetical protein [Edwardsiella hoshinae]|uniref:hypothetical protein n=1 Tax=Edwardsiella hoshinae TaxID=93378 RepID=UPI0012E9A2D6|nr:hypothetical protein [Edwardsiella hoshinae]